MVSRSSGLKVERIAKRAGFALAVLGLLVLGGCSSSEPPPAQQAAMAKTELHFDLNKCELIEPGLYKCPASDKPFVTPTTMAKPNVSESDPRAASSSRADSSRARWLWLEPMDVQRPEARWRY